MTFIGNTATVGSVGYLYSTSSCSWDQFEDPYFDSAQVLNWKFVQQSYVCYAYLCILLNQCL